MKKTLIFFLTLYVFIFNPLMSFAGYMRDDYTISYNNKELSYEKWLDEVYENESNIKAFEIELERIVSLIEGLDRNPTPQNILTKYKEQLRLAGIVGNLGGHIRQFGGPEILLNFSQRLRRIGYPVHDMEIKRGGVDLSRDINPDQLISIIKQHPNSEIEREGLYILAKEYLGGYFMLSMLNDQIRAANLFIEKYPQDSRVEDVQILLDKYIDFYNNKSELDFSDEASLAYLEYSLKNGVDGGLPDWENYFYRPFQVKKTTVEQLLSQELGEVDIKKTLFIDLGETNLIFEKVFEAVSQGWINGYPDGTVRLDQPVNRVEFSKMLALAYERTLSTPDALKKFPDVYLDQWYAPYLGSAVAHGIMQGYPDGTMKPENTINKAEALKMTIELLEVTTKKQQESEPWYEKYRRLATENFDLHFLSENDMNKPMTRGECIELILEGKERFWAPG